MPQEIDFNELFNDSYEYILNNDIEFYETFYSYFINTSPKIKEAFKYTDMTIQKKMLKKAIIQVTNFFVSKKAHPILIKLALKHRDMNINGELYDLFIESFLETLKKTYPYYSEDCSLAWRITLSPGIEFMKHYPDHLE